MISLYSTAGTRSLQSQVTFDWNIGTYASLHFGRIHWTLHSTSKASTYNSSRTRHYLDIDGGIETSHDRITEPSDITASFVLESQPYRYRGGVSGYFTLSLSTISNLESLQLCRSSKCSVETSLTPAAVASLGKTSRNLSWFYMARFPLHDEHMLALFDAIGRAQDRLALKVLDFPQSAKLTIQSWNALFDLLQTNVDLDSVNMYAPPCAKETRTIVYAFLALNQDGERRRLRDCKDIKTWFRLASRFTSLDQNVLFAIVRENPLVCSL